MQRLLLCLSLLSAMACSSGDDDTDIVMIRDGGVRDGGVRDGGRDGGTQAVEVRSFTATFETQGCQVPCVIATYNLNLQLGNTSEFFKVSKITEFRVQIGTFDINMSNRDCTGAWWQVPTRGMTTIQQIPVELFDVAEDDMARNDNAALRFDCNGNEDVVINLQYMPDQRPQRSEMVSMVMRGELEDGTPWEVAADATATCSDVPCL